jgi:hypothetical protein
LDASEYTIVLQNDILKEFVARGAYIFPPSPSLKFSIDAVAYCARHHPHFKPIVICGSHMRQGGATAVQEVAFTMANAQAYIDEAVSRGVHADEFAPSMECQLSVPMNLFEEIAKYRGLSADVGPNDEGTLQRAEPGEFEMFHSGLYNGLHHDRPATPQQHCARHHRGPRRYTWGCPESFLQCHG